MKPFFAVLFVGLWLTVLLVSNATLTPGASLKGVLASSDGVRRDASSPGFSLALSPASFTVGAGGPAQKVTVAAFPIGGFTGAISVQAGNLPAGVTVTPASFTIAAGTLRTISVAASGAAKIGTATIRLSGKSGAMSASTAFTVNVEGLASASLSTNSFNFGNNIVRHNLSLKVVSISNTGTSPLSMSPEITGDASYTIVAAKSCGAELAPAGKCSMVVQYSPVKASAPDTQAALLNMHFSNVAAGTLETVAMSGTSAVLPVGVVTKTDNPQVALYTMTLPFPGRMKVSFGTTKSYGRNTWSQATAAAGGQVSIFVAGMLQNTTYHVRATVGFGNGVTAVDQDHTFTTGAQPKGVPLNLLISSTPGMTPQPGLEFLNAYNGVVITDLAGNPLWTYADPGFQAHNVIQGAKMLSDGNILLNLVAPPQADYTAPPADDAIVEVREVTLGGTTVKEISIDDLNAELSTASCTECNVKLVTFSHDVTVLPNGHWLVIGRLLMNLGPTTTPPLTNGAAMPVLGDVIVDLDEDLQPVWAWNEFNHMDPNRQPMLFPDWTHTNDIVYSPDDGNLLISIRHQNWIVKVDYADGAGKGDILWRLGEGGDFKLVGGTDPTDWSYAQHAPSFTSKKTAGVFSLVVMDNGNDRDFAKNQTCSASGTLPCLYTTIPVYQIDEEAKTATLTFHKKLDASIYSNFGGNAEQLANGNIEYDACGTDDGSYVVEVTQTPTPKTVWQMHATNNDFYRAFRIPSFYPGVQW